MSSSSSSDKNEDKLVSKLNANAPVFEPKSTNKLNLVSEDGISQKVNIKSTMLVSPQRQQIYNFPTYMYPNPMQFQMKIDGNDGPIAIAGIPIGGCTEPQTVVTNPMYVTPLQNSSKKETAATFKQNGNVIFPNISDGDHFVPTMSNAISIPTLSSGNIPIIMSQNNSPAVWHGCAPSPSVALMPQYYSPLNNIYVFRPTVFNPITLPQNKSHMKINIRNKVFDSGDVEQDNILSNIAKTINPLDEFVFRSKNSRFFVIKSFTEDNIYQAIRHSVWCSTPAGNDTLVNAYKLAKSREVASDETTDAHVFLFFSVNGSGYFCGVAEMTSDLNTHSGVNVWNQKKWQAQFSIRWLYIKDIPNSYLRHIKLETNENRPVTNCRDATEILPLEKGIEVLKIIHNLDYDTCLLNDFNQDSSKTDKQ